MSQERAQTSLDLGNLLAIMIRLLASSLLYTLVQLFQQLAENECMRRHLEMTLFLACTESARKYS